MTDVAPIQQVKVPENWRQVTHAATSTMIWVNFDHFQKILPNPAGGSKLVGIDGLTLDIAEEVEVPVLLSSTEGSTT